MTQFGPHTTMEGIDMMVPIPKDHTMGEALRDYIFQRIHQEIKTAGVREIRVTGSLLRSSPAIKAFWETRRSGRPFNFQRPTATIIDDATVELHCFPSRSFVQHYSSMVATYFALSGHSKCILRAIPPPVSEPLDTFLHSNLLQLGPTDIVVLGEVHYLSRLPPGIWWEARGYPANDLFAWHKYLSPTGASITLLGCKESLWGEAAAAIIYALREISGVKCALYVGKVGAMVEKHAPNEWIATGNEAVVEGCRVGWKSPLEGFFQEFREVATGPLVTVSSPLCETQDWFSQWNGNSTWVDCDTGHMAAAAVNAGVLFGYLHIVSDNLAARFADDLSNEDNDVVQGKRGFLYRRIETIIQAFVSSWDV